MMRKIYAGAAKPEAGSGGGDTPESAKGSFNASTQMLTFKNSYLVEKINSSIASQAQKDAVLQELGDSDVVINMNVDRAAGLPVTMNAWLLSDDKETPLGAMLVSKTNPVTIKFLFTGDSGLMFLDWSAFAEYLSLQGTTITPEQAEEQYGAYVVDENVCTVSGTLGNFEVEFIEDEPEASDFVLPENWPDIKSIIQNDTEDYAGKIICMMDNVADTSNLGTIGSYNVQKIKTSDGATYTTAGSTSHSWDRTKDINVSNGTGYRWIIYYYDTDTPDNLNSPSLDIRQATKYFVMDCNMKSSITGGTYGTYRNLEAFEFINGHNIAQSTTSLYGFLNNATSIRYIPKLKTGNVTDFSNFLYGSYYTGSIDIDVSSGQKFYQFLGDCAVTNIEEIVYPSSGITDFRYVGRGTYSFLNRAEVLSSSYLQAVQQAPNNLTMIEGRQLRSFGGVWDLTGTENRIGTNIFQAPNIQDCRIILPKKTVNLRNFSNAYYADSISLESLQFIADNAPDVTDMETAPTLTLGSVNIARAGGASGSIITTLTNKGWIVA